ncbi:nicotinate-nucleotide--dimethylbenzimidazole phosphoribosyltransferase [Lentisphaerota bacterium ZTH]|nr:nicotinate-nucleotide--dimethylbenzimidazole phosphoribosyltransferase [Lentisphaerota bacterium]WET07558.1 nicotinate-nucleotide--dimethylbenzimidazole phosphoribosyltransferase [Lentisphaerota bacterium ZTH]
MGLLESTIAKVEPQSDEYRQRATAHILNLAIPRWSLGRVFDLAVDLCGITRSMAPPVARKHIVVMSGDHGIVSAGVSEQPQAVTRLVTENFTQGKGSICILAEHAGADLTIVDMGINGDVRHLTDSGKVLDKKVANGTASFTQGPAMTRAQATAAVEAGIEIAEKLAVETDVFGMGEMGIGNTSSSSAIVAVMAGIEDISTVVDRGAGLPLEKLQVKIDAIKSGIELNRPDPDDALDVLGKVGGFEIGGLAGLILGAAAHRKPVVIDGFITTAAALIAHGLCPDAAGYMIQSHGSMERGHPHMLKLLDKKPLFYLDLRLGEGTGAALAMNLIDAAVKVMTRMATFEESNITEEGL